MTHNDSPSHDAHDGAGSPASVPASDKRDCGCGCGGSGGCSEGKDVSRAGKIRQGRRKFLIGGIGATAFAASLASRPAYAACNNLTGLYSVSGSHVQTGVCGPSGKTPGFWANHQPCWPSTISPDDTFSTWFGSVSFAYSTETLRTALCPPNGSDNLAFQIAAGLLNAESPNTNTNFGYGSAQAFANAVIAAFQAYPNDAPTYQTVHDRIALMNSDNSTINAWASQGSICT